MADSNAEKELLRREPMAGAWDITSSTLASQLRLHQSAFYEKVAFLTAEP